MIFLSQKKSKSLPLGRGRRNEGDVFFPVSKTSNKPTPSEISNPSKLHFEVLGVGKIQEVFDF